MQAGACCNLNRPLEGAEDARLQEGSELAAHPTDLASGKGRDAGWESGSGEVNLAAEQGRVWGQGDKS